MFLKCPFVLIPVFKSYLESWMLAAILSSFAESPFPLRFCTPTGLGQLEWSSSTSPSHAVNAASPASVSTDPHSSLFSQVKWLPFLPQSLSLTGTSPPPSNPQPASPTLTLSCCSVNLPIHVFCHCLLLDSKSMNECGLCFSVLQCFKCNDCDLVRPTTEEL